MAAVDKPLPLKQVAGNARMAPGKVHRYLVSLARSRFVEQDPISGHYGLGPTAIKIGLAALRRIDAIKVASERLGKLRDETGYTIGLVLWSDKGPVVCRIEESDKPVYMNVKVGSVLPVLRSAVGRVFAAFLPLEKTRRFIQSELSQLNGRPKGGSYTAEWVERLLTSTRKLKLAAVSGDLIPGVKALAAPVFDHQGNIVAAIGLLGRQEEEDLNPTGHVARALQRAAESASMRLGFHS